MDHASQAGDTAIVHALSGLPFTLESPVHVYSNLVPRYVPARGVERPALRHSKLRLYVHVPYCSYRCNFCIYAVRIGESVEAMRAYIKAVRRELEWINPGTPLSQLFMGGGTPTALPPELLDELLGAALERVSMDGARVNTCESSPETITPAHAEVIARRGVGRVSMGIQSLDDAILDGVTRKHTARQAEDAIRMLVQTGLITNVDLIYGLPGQDEDSFRRDLMRVTELGVHSLTVYDLRVSESTRVGVSLADEERLDLERLLRWRTVVRDTAAAAGFVQTRWHTFKRQDSIARNHRWMPVFDESSSGFQLGVGSSARSHLGSAIYRNVDAPRAYVERIESGASPVEQIFELDEIDRRALYISRSIGDGGAIDREHYQASFGHAFDAEHGPRVRRLTEAGLIVDDGNRISLTEVGKLLHDRVTLSFYPPRAIEQLSGKAARIDDKLRRDAQRKSAPAAP